MSDEEDSFETFLLHKNAMSQKAGATSTSTSTSTHSAATPQQEALVGAKTTTANRHDQVFDVSMDKWIQFIEPFTFKTLFLPFSSEEAASLLRWLHCFQIVGGKVSKIAEPSRSDVLCVEALSERVSLALAQFPNKRAFVKLSSRSPKDSVFDCFTEKTASLLDAQLSKNKSILGDDNLEVGAFFAAANAAMCSGSGEEVMDLFLRSARVREDLARALKTEFSLEIVCREFVELPLQSEFRGFVFEGRLVAISQYFWFNYFPDLISRHNEYLDRMVEFFESQVRERIPYASYVVDFAVLDDRIYVIELNPFGDVSGACLFSWKHDNLLLHGILTKKCVLRVRMSPMPDIRNRALVPVWDKYLIAKREMNNKKK